MRFYAGTDTTATPLTLTPAFSATSGQDSATVTYDAGVVPNATTHITAVIVPTTSGATMENDEGSTITSPQSFLLNTNILGTSAVIVVIAPDGTRKEFVIRVRRAAAADDATLSSLTISPTTTALSPAFAADTTGYTANIAASGDFTVTAAATAGDDGAEVAVTASGGTVGGTASPWTITPSADSINGYANGNRRRHDDDG